MFDKIRIPKLENITNEKIKFDHIKFEFSDDKNNTLILNSQLKIISSEISMLLKMKKTK